MSDDLYTAIGFDPGGTTGWAVFSVFPEALDEEDLKILDHVAFWSAGQFVGEESEQVHEMLELVRVWPDDAIVIVEDFVLRTYQRSRDLLSPVRISGAFEYGLWQMSFKPRGEIVRRTIQWQQPALAMSAITDGRLQQCGYWNPLVGQPHARDAVRHVLTWLRREKQERAKANRAIRRATGGV
jgi:hypothetical protein